MMKRDCSYQNVRKEMLFSLNQSNPEKEEPIWDMEL
jgi:hypothetical protein